MLVQGQLDEVQQGRASDLVSATPCSSRLGKEWLGNARWEKTWECLLRAAEQEPAVSSYLKEVGAVGESLFSQITSNGTRGNGCKLRQERFRLDIGKISSPKGWSSIGTGCAGQRVSHHLWRDLKRFVDRALGDRCSGGYGSAGLMVGLHELRIFSNMNDSALFRRLCFSCEVPFLSVSSRSVSVGEASL